MISVNSPFKLNNKGINHISGKSLTSDRQRDIWLNTRSATEYPDIHGYQISQIFGLLDILPITKFECVPDAIQKRAGYLVLWIHVNFIKDPDQIRILITILILYFFRLNSAYPIFFEI